MGALERGLVLKVEGEKVIVLTPEGEFKRIKAPRPCPGIGEEITWERTARLPAAAWRLAWALVALAFFALGTVRLVSFGTHIAGRPAYFVSVDINPSVELALNSEEKVLEAKGLNEDGVSLLDGLELKGQKAEEALKILARAAAEKGYLSAGEEGFLLVSVVPIQDTEEKDQTGRDLAARLAAAAREVVEGKHLPAEVKTATFSEDFRKEAAALGLSPGRYALFLKSRETGLGLTPDEFKDKGVLKRLWRAGVDPGKLWDSLSSELPKVSSQGEGGSKPQEEANSPDTGNRAVGGKAKARDEALPDAGLKATSHGKQGVPKEGGPEEREQNNKQREQNNKQENRARDGDVGRGKS